MGGETPGESLSVYSDFFSSSADLLCIAGPDGRIRNANPAWDAVLGYRPDELKDKTLIDLVHPDDRAAFSEAERQVRAGGQGSCEARFLCRDGGHKWILWRCALSGNKQLLFASASDITARKMTEQALFESETTLRKILDQAPMSMSIVNLDGTIEYINHKAEVTFGYPHTEIPTMDRWWALAYPEEKYRREVIERWMGRVHRALAEKTEIDGGEYHATCKDGTIKTVFIFGVIAANKVFVMFDDISKRVAAEQALREKETTLRRVLEQMPISIAIHDMDGAIEFVNSKFTQTFGYRQEDIKTLDSWASQAYPDDSYRGRLLAFWKEAAAKSLRTGTEIPGGEYRAVCKNGEAKTVFISGMVTADKKVVSLLDDITRRVETEKALRESESRYRALVETTGTGYVIINKEGRVLDANREYVRLTGRKDLKEVLGRTVLEWTAPYEKEKNAAAVADCAAKGFISNFEVDYAGPDGKIIPIEINATVMQKDGVPQILTLCRDITERRETIKLLRESEDKFRTLTERSMVGVYMIQEDKFIYANPALAALSGYSVNELMTTKGPRDLIAVRDWPRVHENIQRRFRGETDSLNYEFTAVKKDGSELDVEVYGSVTEYAGKPAILGTLLDVTARRLAREEIEKLNAGLEQRVRERTAELSAANEDLMQEISQRVQSEKEQEKLREELQQAQKMEAVGRLAGGIAHDFNNILVSISGYAEFLLKSVPASSPGREDLAEILLETEKGALLTRQLLTFSRKQPMQAKVLDLNEVAAETEKMLKRLIGANMHLETRLAPGLDRITADPGQVSQVIMNLVINSRDAMPDGGRIVLETANAEIGQDYMNMALVPKPGHYVMLSVSDTGTGIPPAVKQHLFEPFYTTKEPGKGTGLGLSTVYGIISQVRGGIAVESEPGRGATFRIYFPRTVGL